MRLLPRITTSRLLKSCATPPVSMARLSRRWASSTCRSSLRRSSSARLRFRDVPGGAHHAEAARHGVARHAQTRQDRGDASGFRDEANLDLARVAREDRLELTPGALQILRVEQREPPRAFQLCERVAGDAREGVGDPAVVDAVSRGRRGSRRRDPSPARRRRGSVLHSRAAPRRLCAVRRPPAASDAFASASSAVRSATRSSSASRARRSTRRPRSHSAWICTPKSSGTATTHIASRPGGNCWARMNQTTWTAPSAASTTIDGASRRWERATSAARRRALDDPGRRQHGERLDRERRDERDLRAYRPRRRPRAASRSRARAGGTSGEPGALRTRARPRAAAPRTTSRAGSRGQVGRREGVADDAEDCRRLRPPANR